jgi:hypothetical protein
MKAYSYKEWVFLFPKGSKRSRIIPAIAPLEDLKAAQEELLATRDLEELERVFKRWRRIGWRNVCKLWLEESTPEQLKGEEG